jgi:hypothetical protein
VELHTKITHTNLYNDRQYSFWSFFLWIASNSGHFDSFVVQANKKHVNEIKSCKYCTVLTKLEGKNAEVNKIPN